MMGNECELLNCCKDKHKCCYMCELVNCRYRCETEPCVCRYYLGDKNKLSNGEINNKSIESDLLKYLR